jgi:hypothetical protein
MQGNELFCSLSGIMPIACLTRINFSLKIQPLSQACIFILSLTVRLDEDES